MIQKRKMKFSNFVFEYDKIVVGCTLESLLYAYCYDLPVLFSKVKPPSHIDFFKPQDDLVPFGLCSEPMSLVCADETKEVGGLKLDLWKHLLFFLSLSGNIPMSEKAAAIRLGGDNTLKAITHNSRFARFKFNELIVFDDESISAVPNELIKEADQRYRTLDWMNIKSGMQQKIEYFKTEDDLVNEIYLYPSDRIDGNNFRLKDAVAISYLTAEQLRDFEYSDTYVRFKTLKLFKEAGFRGESNGRCTKNPEKRKYYALKVETVKREVFRLESNIYKDSENIKFNCQTIEKLLQLKPAEDSRPHNLCKQLLGQ